GTVENGWRRLSPVPGRRPGRSRCAPQDSPEPCSPPVITETGLDIQRYICNASFGPHPREQSSFNCSVAGALWLGRATLALTAGHLLLAGEGCAGLAPRPKAILAAPSAGEVDGRLDEPTPATTLAHRRFGHPFPSAVGRPH